MPPQTEAQLQAAAVEWIRTQHGKYLLVHHSPNEGKRGWEGQRMVRKAGVMAGWPDLELLCDGQIMFIELKAKKGRLSEMQRLLHEELRAAGFRVCLCRSLSDVRMAVGIWAPVAERQRQARVALGSNPEAWEPMT